MSKSVFTQQYDLLRELLINARQAKGFTQTDIAQKLKRPQSFVSKYESGERRLDLIEFLEVSKALETNPQTILQKLTKI